MIKDAARVMRLFDLIGPSPARAHQLQLKRHIGSARFRILSSTERICCKKLKTC
jgi:hypothetical protein